jgi:hypothetical protein
MIQHDVECTLDGEIFVFSGKQLEKGRTLAEYGIKDRATIYSVLRLRAS